MACSLGWRNEGIRNGRRLGCPENQKKAPRISLKLGPCGARPICCCTPPLDDHEGRSPGSPAAPSAPSVHVAGELSAHRRDQQLGLCHPLMVVTGLRRSRRSMDLFHLADDTDQRYALPQHPPEVAAAPQCMVVRAVQTAEPRSRPRIGTTARAIQALCSIATFRLRPAVPTPAVR